MAKPEWGTKRRCTGCGAVFYDMQKDPILCPRCGAQNQPEVLLKPRRSRPEEKAVVKPVPKVAVVALDPEADLELAAAAVEDEDFIEDVSELGEDEDDMAEVIEGADEEEPKEES